MSLAETSQLLVELKIGGVTQFKAGISEADAAAAGLGKSVEAAGKSTVATGSVFSQFGGKVGFAKQAIVSTGQAVEGMASHFKNVITGPLGLIGLGAGLFTISGIIDNSIKKVEDFTLGLEKLQGVTGETAQQAGTLILYFEKFGLNADRVAQIAGFAEKTLGKLAETTAKGAKATKSAALQHLELVKAEEQARGASTKHTDALIKEQKAQDQLAAAHGKAIQSVSKLTALDTQYGLHLVDNKGKVVDFSTELGQLADLYDRNIPASTKAFVAAQLFGRGYAAMIPILAQGSAGLREAAAEAGALGLNLGPDTVKKMNDFRDQMRTMGEQVNILQLRIGMALIPVASKFVGLISDWLSSGGSDQLVKFFTDAGDAASKFADVLTGSVFPTIHAMASAALAAWNTIPAPLRDIIVKGFVADRTIHFLFGVSPLNLAKNLLGDVLGPVLGRLGGGLFQRGGSPATPLFVSDVSGGLGGGGAAGGGLLSGALKLAIPVLGGLAIAAAWKTIVQDPELQKQTNQNQASANTMVTTGAKTSDLVTALNAAKTGLQQLTNAGFAQPLVDALYGGQINATKQLISTIQAELDKREAAAYPLTHRDPAARNTARSYMEANRGVRADALAAAESAAKLKEAAARLKEAAAREKEVSAANAAAVKQTASHILSAASSRDAEASAAIKKAIHDAAAAIQARATTVLNTAARHDAETSTRVQAAIREMKPPSVAVAISIGGVALAQSVIHRTTTVHRYGPSGGTRQTSARQNESFFP